MLHAYTFTNDQLAVAPEIPPAGHAVTWLDLTFPTPEEDAVVEQRLGVSVPSREEMKEIELSSRLYVEDGAVFMTLTALADLDTDHPGKTPITFILRNGTLATVRYAELKPIAAFNLRAQKPRAVPCSNGEQVMFGILEALIDRTADALEKIGDDTDALSREIFASKGKVNKKTRNLQRAIEQIGPKVELLSMVQESLVSMSRLVSYHAAVELGGVKPSKEGRGSAKLIQRDSVSLSEHARALAARLNFLLDATLGMINLEQNQIIKIFSVAAVVFLPPTLVASIYGMNFDIMPELKWTLGYPWALCLMILSAILPYVYFKRRGWL